ncbi:MAG: PQQ-dependent sugar dehydrogenase [Acidobacteriota bacterium]
MVKYIAAAVATALLALVPMLAQNPPAAPPAPPEAGRQGTPPDGRQGASGAGRGPTQPGPGRSNNPFPDPIPATEGAIKVNVTEFASVPEAAAQPPRMNLLIDEPGTRRMFVNTMQGLLYSLSYDGKTVSPYLDLNDPKWGHPVQAGGSERGFQSFAFHPQFTQSGTPGFGKLYTYADTTDMTPTADFVPTGTGHTHDEILLEWTAADPRAAAYDGAAPRELFRVAHPFGNHNGGQIAFNPLVRPGTPEFGLLYVGSADGGSGGDPYSMAQNLKSIFGKILRIDPLGRNSANKKYGIPAANPFVKNPDALGEIYSYGHRNPQRFSWDPANGNMFEAEIGQNLNEEINQIKAGGNYGWNIWEGGFKYYGREVGVEDQRSDPAMIFPIVDFDHTDPLFPSRSVAATGIYVYRGTAIASLTGKLIFGDNPSGELFYVNADSLPNGGQNFHRLLFNDKGQTKTLLDLIKEKNTQQGRTPATRADLRMGVGPNGQLFVLNKRDGIIRLLVP